MLRRIAPWLVTGLMLFVVHGAVAQDEAEGFFAPLDAAFAAAGWSVVHPSKFDDAILAQFPFVRAGSGRVYGGPDGSRAVVGVFVSQPGASAGRQAWDFANELFDDTRSTIDGAAGFRDLDATAPPEGCDDARRAEGEDDAVGAFEVGVTLCAADPDVIVLAYVSGEWDGLTETAASDDVVEAALALRPDATPVATP